MTALRQPAGLDKAGAALWRRLIDAHDLDVWEEVAVVSTACKQADDNARLEALLADGGLIIEGSAGSLGWLRL